MKIAAKMPVIRIWPMEQLYFSPWNPKSHPDHEFDKDFYVHVLI